MNAQPRPQIECKRLHASIYAIDVPSAVDFYTTRLGFTVGFLWGGEPPTMAGLNLDEVQIFVQKGEPEPQGCVLHFVVGNADELFQFHRENGVEVFEEIGDREYGLRDYVVRDLYGHYLQFGQYIYTVGEPIEIERVAVPVRLEKRLAGLLQDLADYKRMTLSSTLEEILLHTSDQLPDGGVPSPHTEGQLRHIQELKKKHGIDYDSHGSYRFVEKR